MKATFPSLSLVVAISALCSGCFSYSSTERTVPAPAPAPVYVERPVQPVPPTYVAPAFDRGAYRSVEDCLNAASAAHVPLEQCR
jgi:hypothetical protein